MDFEIILNPNFEIGEFDSEDSTISEALDNMNVNSQYFTMKWNVTQIKLNYGLSMADGIRDIIKMLEFIKKRESQFVVTFPSQQFFETWICKIKGNNLNIKWESREDYEDITVDTDLFIKEWIKLLFQLRKTLIRTGYNSSNLVDFNLLENIESYLP